MALVSKKKKGEASPKQQFIRINPYEVHENVLHLMSQVSSAKPTANSEAFWEPIRDVLYDQDKSMHNFFISNREKLSDIDFFEKINKNLHNLDIELQTRENTNHTQIVVAGGFSSGKSSFLNRMVNDGNLLPTGVQPVSVVPTYLYCTQNNTETIVKGVNFKNAVVALPKEVLQAIQHSNKSNIHIASVLEKLFVEVSAPKVKDIVFIDTPGYNNSTKKNDSNGKTDEETARESLKEGQALIWLIDCEKGNTVADDLDFISEFKGPKLIVFNKADKKGEVEAKKIVEENGDLLDEKFGDDLIDVIAYSSRDNKMYASYYESESIDEIFDEIREECGTGKVGRKGIIKNIQDIFDDEIMTSKKLQEELNFQKLDAIEEKKKASLDSYEVDERYSGWEEYINDVAQSYVDLENSRDEFREIAEQAFEEFSKFYDKLVEYRDDKLHFYVDSFNSILRRGLSLFSQLENRYSTEDNRDIDIYEEDDILNDFVEKLVKDSEILRKQEGEGFVKSAEERFDKLRDALKSEKELESSLIHYKEVLLSAIEKGIRNYEKSFKAEKIRNAEHIHIFTAIEQGNLAALTYSMAEDAKKDDLYRKKDEKMNAYNMAKCNPQGYTVLTYAVKQGQPEIVKFLLDNEADPYAKDKRGYNAFLTAVEEQNQSMCELLLSYDSDLMDTKTNAGESVSDLLNKHSFSKWLSKQM